MSQFITPVPGRLTQGFFPTRVPPHFGVDIGAPDKTTVLAAQAGRVIFEGIWGLGGNTLHIKGSDGYVTIYCHLSQFLVNLGSTVTQGQPIALSGGNLGEVGAGNSKGAHLHFEIHTTNFSEANPSASAVDPQNFISVGGAALSPTQSSTIPSAAGNAVLNGLKHIIFPWTLVPGASAVVGGVVKDIPGVGAAVSTAEATKTAANFLTKKQNWIRIGEFAAGVAILALVLSKTIGKDLAPAAKVAALA